MKRSLACKGGHDPYHLFVATGSGVGVEWGWGGGVY